MGGLGGRPPRPTRRDHVHLCLSIRPKYSVAHTIGFLKGKSAVRIHREILKERRMTGLHFWATGYCVSTVGLDEARVLLDEALDLSLAARSTPFVTLCLSGYAQLASAEGDPDQAALLEGNTK